MGWQAGGRERGQKGRLCKGKQKRHRDIKRQETWGDRENWWVRDKGGDTLTSATERAWEGSRGTGRATTPGWRNRNLRSNPEAKEEEACAEGQGPGGLTAGSHSETEAKQRKAWGIRGDEKVQVSSPCPSISLWMAGGHSSSPTGPSSPLFCQAHPLTWPQPTQPSPAQRGGALLLTCTAEADCLLSLFPGELRPEACCSRNCRATWRACKTG